MTKNSHSRKAVLSTLGLVAMALLSGCVAPPPPGPAPDAEVMAKLASYSERASISMQRLASLKVSNAVTVIQRTPAPPGLEVPVSITWSGPVDQLVQKISELTGYQYGGVLGNSKTPVLVSMAVVDHTAFTVLADAAAQIGSAADIVIHPDTKKMFVKYPPATGTGGYPVQTR